MATASKKPAVEYNESSLKALTSVEAVRQKAGMYIGPTDAHGVFTILREAMDNVVDEALGGFATQVSVLIADDGSYYVHDNGRGMPTGPMEVSDSISNTKHKLPAIQVITSVLHAGGKLDANSAYAVSRGSHGIGIKATNFLSEFFNVTTFYKGAWWTLGFKKGKLVKELTKLKSGTIDSPFGNKPLTKGTLVHFKPDATIFSAKSFPGSYLGEWANMAAYFTKNFTVEIQHHSGKVKVINHPGGAAQFVTDHVVKLACQPLDPAVFQYTNELADVVFQFTNYDGCSLQAFTNGLSNPEKGVHFNALFSALLESLQPYVKKKQEFTMNELKDGVVGVINCKMSSPRFASQTKEKLVDERGDKPVYEMLLEQFTAFFKKNKALADTVCQRCFGLKQLKNQFKASKEVLTKLRKATQGGLPAKASVCSECSPTERELFIVEGDSAAGGGREARDPYFQEMLPLKGKIKNAQRHKPEEVLLSEEVIYILAMIGFDAKAENPIANLRVGKIICMSDPDPDGNHINSLELSLLWKFMPGLFKAGMIYLVDVPEYYSVVKGENVFADSTEELRKILKGLNAPVSTPINHIKGWGEVPSSLMEKAVFNPATRKLKRVTVDSQSGNDKFVLLMSEDVQTRKTLLGV